MRVCDLTLPTAEENLACDEALLDLADCGQSGELLRFWEPRRHFVVLGYANQARTEVNLAFCEENSIPVLRRCSGGGTVLQGPGCLNYSLVLDTTANPQLASISGTNKFIMSRNQEALSALLQIPAERVGLTDLALNGLKFSGNAQRRKRRFLLFHGSFLLQMDIDLIEKALPLPSRRPDYRLDRSHVDFLVNLNLPAHLVKSALAKAWDVTDRGFEVPLDAITKLAREKYSRPEWSFKF